MIKRFDWVALVALCVCEWNKTWLGQPTRLSIGFLYQGEPNQHTNHLNHDLTQNNTGVICALKECGGYGMDI